MNVLSPLTRRTLPILAAALIFSLAAPAMIAQSPSPTWAQDDTLRIAQEVQKRLGSLNNYSVFDWITFGFHGKTAVLKGSPLVRHSRAAQPTFSRALKESSRSTTRSKSSRFLLTTIVSALPSTTASIGSPACGNITPTRAVSRKRWDPVAAASH